MGWWWSDAPRDAPSTQEASSSALPESRLPDSLPSSLTDAQPPTRDEAAFEDLKSLFTAINPEAASRAAETARNPPPALSPEEEAESLYPTTMKCSQAFDNAYYCSSMGGQLNNIYRYGGLRSCTDQWKQWRFCMRCKAMGEEERKRRIREWYMERDARKRVGTSSERVWEVRTEPVVGAFSKSVDDFDAEHEGGATGIER